MKQSTSKIKVRLPESTGVRSCGQYQSGKVYEVDADEAQRLIDVKRFERVDGSKAKKEA